MVDPRPKLIRNQSSALLTLFAIVALASVSLSILWMLLETVLLIDAQMLIALMDINALRLQEHAFAQMIIWNSMGIATLQRALIPSFMFM